MTLNVSNKTTLLATITENQGFHSLGNNVFTLFISIFCDRLCNFVSKKSVTFCENLIH